MPAIKRDWGSRTAVGVGVAEAVPLVARPMDPETEAPAVAAEAA